MTKEDYELRRAVNSRDVAAYHHIRRSVLFDARGRTGYDENYPEEQNPSNWPLLLIFKDRPVCAFRLDTSADGMGIIRLMAVDQPVQKQGHGSKAISLLIDMARQAGLNTLEVNSASDAVTFYQRHGFSMIDAARESPLLRLSLAPWRR